MGVDKEDDEEGTHEKGSLIASGHSNPSQMKQYPELTFIKAQKFETASDNFFCNIFLMKYDGPIKIQEEELDGVEYWTLQEMYENLFNKNLKITPDSKMCFKELMKSELALFKLFGVNPRLF